MKLLLVISLLMFSFISTGAEGRSPAVESQKIEIVEGYDLPEGSLINKIIKVGDLTIYTGYVIEPCETGECEVMAYYNEMTGERISMEDFINLIRADIANHDSNMNSLLPAGQLEQMDRRLLTKGLPGQSIPPQFEDAEVVGGSKR